jgi:hypothetical protein
MLASTANSQDRVRHALGEFEYAASSNGVLIAAPHGTFDANTAQIALEASKRAGAGYVVAWRFVASQVRINVNRPTEGAFLPCAQETASERAQSVYDAYAGIVQQAGELRLYVEVHGNSNPKTAQMIEVATVGVAAAEAQALKDAYPAMLARVRESVRDFPEVALLVEPVDRILYTAGCAKKLGVLSRVARGVHFEFPRSTRERNAVPGAAMIVAEIVRRLQEK